MKMMCLFPLKKNRICGKIIIIAEFLKAYHFVKEYGEGVDRMCRELENAGLRVPEYHCNAFMLQTVIYNANAKKLAIGVENPAIGEEKLAIENKKLAIETLKLAIKRQKCSEPTQRHMLQVYENMDTNQIFGTSEITSILGCSDATARRIMSKFRSMNVVREVKGKGKGKYRFVNEDE